MKINLHIKTQKLKSSKADKLSRCSSGMTIIELVVVMGIFAAISGVILFNFTGFSTNVSVQNLSQDIALRIKNAQTAAISGKFNVGFISPNVPAYGIYFDVTSSANQKKFIYFADLDNSGLLENGSPMGSIICQPQSGTQCQEETTIQTGDIIEKLCLNEESTAPNCGNPVDNVYISFKRPFPDTIIRSTSAFLPYQINDVEIKVLSSKGVEKTIIVWATGQISVK